MKDLSWW